MLSRIWVPQGELEQYSPEQLSKLQLLLARMSVVVADVRMACSKGDRHYFFSILLLRPRCGKLHVLDGCAKAGCAYAHSLWHPSTALLSPAIY